jgi:hypothetical protein
MLVSSAMSTRVAPEPIPRASPASLALRPREFARYGSLMALWVAPESRMKSSGGDPLMVTDTRMSPANGS